MLKLKYYSTNVGIFFSIISNANYYGSSTLASQGICSVDGQPVEQIEKTGDWYHIQGELKNFMKKIPESKKQVGWKLKNSKLESEQLPLYLGQHKIVRTYDDDDEYEGDFAEYHSLYEPDYDVIPSSIEPVEVEASLIRELNVGNYSKPAEMKVQYRDGNFGGKTQIADLSKIASLSEIETLLTPEFMQHTRPCSLTSQQVYKIVREHVINHINGAVARIDSNYDFCFSAVKKVNTKPYVVKKESYTRGGNSYKPPRFVGRTVDTKDVKIFEMTWKGADKDAGYGTYPIIEGWQADNLQELYDNMQRYLAELMEVINAPAKECQHCNGTGYECAIISTNQR